MRESVSQVGGCCVTERAATRSFPRIHIHHHMPDDYDEDEVDDDDVVSQARPPDPFHEYTTIIHNK